jgi:hypothetical protein
MRASAICFCVAFISKIEQSLLRIEAKRLFSRKSNRSMLKVYSDECELYIPGASDMFGYKALKAVEAIEKSCLLPVQLTENLLTSQIAIHSAGKDFDDVTFYGG